MTCVHHYSIIQNSFTALKILYVLYIHPSFPPALVATDLFTISIVLPFPECHTVGIILFILASFT